MRIATFNIENLGQRSDDEERARFSVLAPKLRRTRADVFCFQEIHAQGDAGNRELRILQELLDEAGFGDYDVRTTTIASGEPRALRNLVIASRFPVISSEQYNNDLIPSLQYRRVTAEPPDGEDDPLIIRWERPILYSQIAVSPAFTLHVINIHFKSKIPTPIPGQTFRRFNRTSWQSIGSYAEGYYISSIKRVGQALETRALIDQIFAADPLANVIVCGDFNADPTEVPLHALLGNALDINNPALNDFLMFSIENTIPESSRFTLYHHGNANLLDHLIMSQNMIQYYDGAEIHNEDLADESIMGAYDDLFPGSDHSPFVARFELGDNLPA